MVFEKIQPNSEIQIVDLSGIVVKSFKNNEENFSIKVPFAGTYVVNIVDVNGNCTKEKVIVKQ
ncbi:MAG: T9SS type A sorting domain-containing protein [Paludibacteraceae bacterium]|nr:T9SS type A sorting domain-containing protein [Paludibacteraceae bacterium]